MLMKINKAIFFAFFLVVISFSSVFAESNPLPQPPQSSQAKNGDVTTQNSEPFPEMPIDQNIVYLMGAALVLGFVMIYKGIIKKASV